MLEAYIDGACEPVNPGGTASYGVLILRQGLERYGAGPGDVEPVVEPVWEDYGIVGSGPKMSNNVSEYAALVKLLEWLDKNLLAEIIVVNSDSQMLVNQMSGKWKARSDKLYYPYYQRALTLMLIDEFSKGVKFKWIPREQNLADELSIRALTKIGIVRRR